MKRRKFLQSAPLAALGGVALLAPSSSFATKKQRWRMSLAVPKTMAIWGDMMERFAKKVELLTGGELQIKIYGAGELIPALGGLDAVSAGELQMNHAASYYWQGKIPASAFFTSVPFGMDAQGTLAWLEEGDGQKLYDELMHPLGVQCFPCGTTGFQVMGWFNKPINTMADLKGLKIRIPGIASKVYSKAGATPVLIPGGETFTSLSTGVIDAVEWIGPYNDYLMGFHKGAKYYYGDSWHETGSVLELMIEKKAWDSLSEQAKTAIQVSCQDATIWSQSQWTAKNGEYLEKIRSEGKVEVRNLPTEVLQGLKKISEEVKLEVAKTSPLAKRIYENYSNFQRERYDNFERFAGGFYLKS